MVNYLKVIIVAIALLLFSGCCCSYEHKEANIANAHLIQDINDTIHLFYNIELGKYKEFHHLKMENNEWVELIDINLNEEIITAFNNDSNVCLLTYNYFKDKPYTITCLKENETTTYPCNINIPFGGDEYIFLPEGYFVYHNSGYFYKYDPFLDKETKLFEAFGYIAGDFFPYIDTNGSWDGRTIVYNNISGLELIYADENSSKDYIDGVYSDYQYPFFRKDLYPYVIVKDKFYNMPLDGKIITVANDNLLVNDADTYFGDPNLAVINIHDTVEEDGTFHHLDNFYSNSSEESRLTYEQYIPSQSEAVKSEVIFYHKVKNEF